MPSTSTRTNQKMLVPQIIQPSQQLPAQPAIMSVHQQLPSSDQSHSFELDHEPNKPSISNISGASTNVASAQHQPTKRPDRDLS